MSFSSFVVVASAAYGLEIFNLIGAVSGKGNFVIYLGGWFLAIDTLDAFFGEDAAAQFLPFARVIKICKSFILKIKLLGARETAAVSEAAHDNKIGASGTQGNVAPRRVITICCLKFNELFQGLSTEVHSNSQAILNRLWITLQYKNIVVHRFFNLNLMTTINLLSF